MTTMHDLKVGYITLGEDPWAPYFELVLTARQRRDR
jgi:hypothetical protein